MSKLARCLPLTVCGVETDPLDAVDSVIEPVSIWKGNEPNPFDIVDVSDAVDMPSIFLLLLKSAGGGGWLFDFLCVL